MVASARELDVVAAAVPAKRIRRRMHEHDAASARRKLRDKAAVDRWEQAGERLE